MPAAEPIDVNIDTPTAEAAPMPAAAPDEVLYETAAPMPLA
jgi:hypothetical protein